MELSKQIKKYRTEMGLSQDELAERLYVSRQTISNWENDKNYPDIKSIALLSYIFNVSVDDLIKGDIEDIKEIVQEEDIRNFNRYSAIMGILMIILVVSLVPLLHFFYIKGFVVWGVMYAICLYFTLKVEAYKKKFNIQTYKEILAFSEGKKLNEAEKNQEYGKRPYQKVLIGISAAVITLAVALLFAFVLGDL